MYLSLSIYFEGLSWMFDALETAERRAQLEHP